MIPKYRRNKVQKIKLQDTKVCYVTGRTDNLHKHHVFCGNGKRALSEKYGLYVWLRPDWHNMSDYGVHFNSVLDLELKQMAQAKFEETYSRAEFVRLFGKSYL
jgi:hypothetical protein